MNRKLVSEVMVTLLLLGMLTLTFNVHPAEASGTIYIKADGSVEGTTYIMSDDNVTYTFTNNIYGEIVVERDNIVVDGAGHTLDGMGDPISTGISLLGISNVTIRNTNIKRFWYGISLKYSSNNTISGSNITNNVFDGIELLWDSDFNCMYENNITNNSFSGIELHESDYNSIHENSIANTIFDGIEAYRSSSNSIYGNRIVNNWDGIWLCILSHHNNIYANNIVNNIDGIYVWQSSNNTAYHNNLINNTYHVYTDYQTTTRTRTTNGNKYFKGRGIHPAPIVDPVNVWDDGYPSGGNFWSDYTTRYPDAQELDDSGIWDTPYVIDENNQDNYPLMETWTPSPPLPRTIDELKTEIEKCRSEGEIDNHGIVKSLLAKLNVAQKLVDKEKIDEAKSILEEDFIPQVQNLTDIHITPEAADILIQSAEHIISSL